MSLAAKAWIHKETGVPRVSGDEPIPLSPTALVTTFSPRERG